MQSHPDNIASPINYDLLIKSIALVIRGGFPHDRFLYEFGPGYLLYRILFSDATIWHGYRKVQNSLM